MHYCRTMSATATIEQINCEQIATRTDLLLVRARHARVRLSNNKAAFSNDVRVLARGSHPSLQRDPDRTLFIRVRRVGSSTTSAAVLATVFAIAIVLTSLL